MITATQRKWSRGVELYFDYCTLNDCMMNGIPVYPSSDVCAAYATWLTDFKGSSPRDTTQRVLGVARWAQGLEPARGDPRLGPDGRLDFLLYSVLRGIRRRHARKKRIREALTTDKLTTLLQYLLADRKRTPADRTMFAALLSLGTYGLCRCGELTSPTTRSRTVLTPTLADVRIVRGDGGALSHLEFTIKGSKVDVFREGAVVRVYATGTALCPVALMADHLRNAAGRPRDSPLFVRSDGRFVTRDNVNTLIKELATQAGFNPDRYSTHSMRAGGATTLALLGYQPAIIQRLGRWVSDAYAVYVGVSEDTHRTATRQMATLAPCSTVSRAAAARVANTAWARLRQQL